MDDDTFKTESNVGILKNIKSKVDILENIVLAMSTKYELSHTLSFAWKNLLSIGSCEDFMQHYNKCCEIIYKEAVHTHCKSTRMKPCISNLNAKKLKEKCMQVKNANCMKTAIDNMMTSQIYIDD